MIYVIERVHIELEKLQEDEQKILDMPLNAERKRLHTNNLMLRAGLWLILARLHLTETER